MNRKLAFLALLLLSTSILLSGCSGLLSLEDEPVGGEFGPKFSAEEHQMRTFDSLWKNMQEAYIYYDTADVNWNALHETYVDKIQSGLDAEQFTTLLKGLQKDLPEGGIVYESRPERVETDIANASIPATIEGIGAILNFEERDQPHLVVMSVIQGSPAEAAGLKAHDSIVSIDGKPITTEEGANATSRIRGPADSTVKLGIRSPGEQEHTIEIKRAKITGSPKLEAYKIVGTDYGYLLFPPVEYQGLDQDVFNSLQTLSTEGELKGLILDLRIASATPQWPIDTLLTIFQNGKIGEFYNRSKRSTLEVKGQDVVGSQTMPLTVVVGEKTQGFAEVFAAGLQLNKRAVIIGEKTPGAVETQAVFYLPDGSRLFVESTSFQLANGEELGTTGVIPDVQAPGRWDEVNPDHDPALQQAIEILQKAK
jgi:carboxyl-terminal processing protease